MSAYELAQLNIARMKEPLESPTMADFVANLDRINALAESSPGFVWRLRRRKATRLHCARWARTPWSTCRCGGTSSP